MRVAMRSADMPGPGSRFGQDVTDGTLDLKLDQNGMVVSGPVTYAGADLNIEWRQAFGDKVDVRESFQAKGRTSTGSRALVGYDFRPWVDGPSDVALKFSRRDDGRGARGTLRGARLTAYAAAAGSVALGIGAGLVLAVVD